MVGKVDYADFLVLMTGRSNRHVDALAQSIDEACAKKRQRSLSVEGLPAATWVLIDFGDVVVHVFQEEAGASTTSKGYGSTPSVSRCPAKSPKGKRARGCASSFSPWARSKSAAFAKRSTTISPGCGVMCRSTRSRCATPPRPSCRHS